MPVTPAVWLGWCRNAGPNWVHPGDSKLRAGETFILFSSLSHYYQHQRSSNMLARMLLCKPRMLPLGKIMAAYAAGKGSQLELAQLFGEAENCGGEEESAGAHSGGGGIARTGLWNGTIQVNGYARFTGTRYVCAVAEGAFYWDWWDWDEWDRGDPADDGVCGFGVGPAGVGDYGTAGGVGRDDLCGTRGGECCGQ